MSNGSAKAVAPHTAAVRADAIDAFRANYRGRRLAPVVAVIAAFDEADCIADVLNAVPARACGLAVDTLVVDDGSGDMTAAVSRAAGARVARLARNCGHGVALRVGYELAREHGASYIVTLDADGQWDPAELPKMLEPLVRDEADLVIGSRILGRDETDSALRKAGVRVFAALVRRLTGTRVTDTSSGYRAMRAELTATVPQRQVQYQTAELLIGAIYHGYRVAERPIVMHRRASGESKKGNELLYGLRYARVVLATWWRERRPGGARLLPALRAIGFVAAVAVVVIMAWAAAREVHPRDLTWWPLAPAALAAIAWWLLLGRGWALLLRGAATRADVAAWCRTQTLRYLPGGIWAPVSRAAFVDGNALDRLSTVGAENVIALCAALALGGVALAAGGHPLWLGLGLAVAVPLLLSGLTVGRTRVGPRRARRATLNYVVAFVAYALCAVLVQASVSGLHDPLAVAGAAAVAWGAGLVVIIAPGGVGVRELAYVGLLADSFATADLAAAAVTMRLLTIAAELAVLLVVGRPASPRAIPGLSEEHP